LDERLYWKLHRDATELGEIASIFRGIPLGANSPLVADERRSPDDLPVLRGASVGRFRIRQVLWLDRAALRRLPSGTTQRFVANRIVVQNMFSREAGPIATMDTTGMATLDTVTNIVPDEGQNSAYILGILNSKLAYYFLVQFVFAQSYLTMHMDRPYVGRLPIKRPRAVDGVDLQREIAGIAQAMQDSSLGVESPTCQKLGADLDRLTFQLYDVSASEADRILVAIQQGEQEMK
jgi:hypothetical protein